MDAIGTLKEQSYSRQLLERLRATIERFGDGLTHLETQVEDVIRKSEPFPKTDEKDERQPTCYMEEQLLNLCNAAESREAQLLDIARRIAV